MIKTRPIRSVLSLAIGLLALLTLASAGQTRDPATYFCHDSFNDLREEGEIARQEGKVGVLVMFETDDCPWCRRMKETVLNQVEVQDYFRTHFQVIAINVEGDALVTGFDGKEVPETEFALKHNRVRATPVFALLRGKRRPCRENVDICGRLRTITDVSTARESPKRD